MPIFGYIKPVEPELRVRELDVYKAVYCGVCRELSREYGPFARLTLSYDFTFAAMLLLSLSETPPTFAPRRCPYNPLKQRPHLESCDALRFSCDAAMLLLDCKTQDNAADSTALARIGWHLLLPLTHTAARRAGSRQDAVQALFERMMQRQAQVEQDPDATVDAACDPTAEALAGLFAQMVPNDAPDARILSRLGYMLGRYIYLCDAMDDLSDDLSDGSFNPFRNNQDLERQTEILRATIAEACRAYALLSPRYFKEILDNILYLGLGHTVDRLIAGRKSQ